VKGNEFANGLAGRLIDLQNADGGWATSEQGVSATEPTSWALRALESVFRDPASELSVAEARDRAVSWLALRQLQNGAWPGSERVPEPGASTGIAVLALAACPESELQDRAVAGGTWLLQHPGRRVSWRTRLWLRLNPDRNLPEIDMRLRGWPWMEGMWGWVEPTSIALIAFRSLGDRLPRSSVSEAIDDGESMLLDRTCPAGGWNHGLGRSHEEDLWPYPDTTAFALLALGPNRTDKAVSEGMAALLRMLESPVSRLTTALGILTFERFGQDAEELRRRLVEEWTDPFLPPTTRTLALSLMAARGDTIGTAGGTESARKRAGND
jgi:hypothetical protein